MHTRAELDDVPYKDKKWLAALPKHLQETAVALQDMFELQPASWRRFTRSKMRAWITEMRNRTWLIEQHIKLERGISLLKPDAPGAVIIDASANAPGLRRKIPSIRKATRKKK